MALRNVNLNDKSGGFLILEAGSRKWNIFHRMRFHIPAFADAAGPRDADIPYDRTYLHPQGGREDTVGKTCISLIWCLRGMFDTSFGFHLAGLYMNQNNAGAVLDAAQVYGEPNNGGGQLVPVYPYPTVPAGGDHSNYRGTSGGTRKWLAGQVTTSFRSAGGGRGRLILLSSQEWDPTDEKREVAPSPNGTSIQVTCSYLTGDQVTADNRPTMQGFHAASQRSMVTPRDGTVLLPPCIITNALNHRVRRALRYT